MSSRGNGGAWAFVRALALVWLSTVASLLAHAAAGGPLPDPRWTAGLVFGLTLLCAPWAQHGLTRARATGLLTALQLAVHVLAMWLPSERDPLGPSASGAQTALLGGHHHHGHSGAPAPRTGAPADSVLDSLVGLVPSLPMAAAHLAVAVAAGCALSSGERSWRVASGCWSALFRTARRALAWLVAPACAAPSPAPPAPVLRDVFHWKAPRLETALWAPQGAVRRGPPSLLAA